MIKLQVPATTANLGPGFDTLGLALSLYNDLEVEEIDTGLEIEVVGYGTEELPTDKSNLIYQAMTRLFQEVNYQPTGLYLKLTNRIPLARGLGSSAAAIVAGLKAANLLAGEPLVNTELINLATELEGHPDNVAPALLGGVVISHSEAGQVVYDKILAPDLQLVVCIPDYQLTTADSRAVLPDQVQFEDAAFNISQIGLLVTGLLKKDYTLLARSLQDRIHQPYRQELLPGFAKMTKRLEQSALGVVISGSGPTVVALTLDQADQIGEKMVATFAEEGIKAEYLVTNPTNKGIIDV
ncbi:homoserine kinase [Halanaerobaculum tunisiense]